MNSMHKNSTVKRIVTQKYLNIYYIKFVKLDKTNFQIRAIDLLLLHYIAIK